MPTATVAEDFRPASVAARELALPAVSRWRRSGRVFLRHRLAVAGAVVCALVVSAALLAPRLAPYDPAYIDLLEKARAPSPAHPLGTDRLGRDILSRLLYGAQVSLAVGGSAITLAAVLGLLAGGLAGYWAGSWVDVAISRLIDLLLALPTFFLLVAVQSILTPSAINVIAIIAATAWMALARIVRGQILSLREREFVVAARALGASPLRVLAHHLLPNLAPQVVVFATLGMADAILVEASLSFLGLGVPPYQPSWGNMLIDGQIGVLAGQWWIALFPGLAILTTALAVNLAGDGIQDALFR